MDQDAVNKAFGPGANLATPFAFHEPGDSVTGTVVDVVETERTDLEGNVRRFPNKEDGSPGNPMMQWVITVQTDLAEDEEDDGLRRLFVYGARTGKGSFGAICTACAEAGAALEPGGVLSLTYTGVGTPSKRGYNPPKEYEASYTPPEGE